MFYVLSARIFGFRGQLQYKISLDIFRGRNSLYGCSRLPKGSDKCFYISSFDSVTMMLGIYANRLRQTSCHKTANNPEQFLLQTTAYHLFQIKPTRCTLLLSIYISTSLHVSCNYVPIIRRTYCIYATLVFFTLYGWLSGLQTRQPPIHA